MKHPFLTPIESPVILASGSPRRAQILRQHGLEFEVEVSGAPEHEVPGEGPEEHVLRLALEKVRTVAARNPQALCIGCDTVVVLDEKILGKPRDEDEARAMITELADREHRVFSSIALVHESSGFAGVAHQLTWVQFRALDATEVAKYVATGEPMDKAGAYGIQGYGAMLVSGIRGCYFNVMGLPLEALRRLWNEYARETA